MSTKTVTAEAKTASAVKESTLTPYAAAKFVNEQLEKAGLSKRIPPQMMYNYTSSRINAGKKPFIEYSLEGGVELASLKTWCDKYVAKQTAVEAK